MWDVVKDTHIAARSLSSVRRAPDVNGIGSWRLSGYLSSHTLIFGLAGTLTPQLPVIPRLSRGSWHAAALPRAAGYPVFSHTGRARPQRL